MSINFELYKQFYFVAKEKQISRAAKKLHITQPALTQSIKLLEHRLGGSLFYRTPKGVKLTNEGETLFRYIEKGVELFDSGERKFQQMISYQDGEITIGGSDTICSYFLLPYLEKFHRLYPNLKIRVTNGTTNDSLELLKSGGVDLGFVNLPVDGNNLDITPLKTIDEVFICGRKYMEKFRGKVSLKKLSNFPLIMLEKSSNTRGYLDKLFNDHGLKVEPEIELGSNDLLAKFTKIGLGISYINLNSVRDDIDRGDLHIIDIKEKIPKRSIGVVRLKGFDLSFAGKLFLDFIIEGMEN